MLLNVLDADGNHEVIVVAGQETVVDRSGAIAEAATAQNVMEANAARSGWFFKNTNVFGSLWVSDVGAAVADGTCFEVGPGNTWPPAGYPLSTGALSVIGTTVDDTFIAREW